MKKSNYDICQSQSLFWKMLLMNTWFVQKVSGLTTVHEVDKV